MNPSDLDAAVAALSTPLTELRSDAIVVGGQSAEAIVATFTFEAMVDLVLGLGLDDDGLAVLRACLVVNADHGLASNATTAALAATATTRSGVAQCVAAGVLAIGESTISPAPVMRFLEGGVARWRESGGGLDEHAGQLVQEAVESGQRLPGFGSPMHPAGDPRVPPLERASQAAGRWSDHCALFAALHEALRTRGKDISPNEVGMTGAVLADLGLSPEQGEAVSVIGAIPSIAANVLAERGRPARFLVARPLLES